MKRNDDPAIVSLDSHRRRRAQDARKKQTAKPRSNHERAINWRRAPLFLAAVVLFMLASWLLRNAASLLHFAP